jgi:hypothetical protein
MKKGPATGSRATESKGDAMREEPTKPGKGWVERLIGWMWPVVALASVAWSLVLLEGKLEAEASSDPLVRAMLDDGPFASDAQIIAQALAQKLSLIPFESYLLAAASTLVAYFALAWYDRIGLRHLGRESRVSLPFTCLCSFVSYALGHNIGASVLSGGAVRLRAYTSQGLSKTEVAGLVAFCSLTFGLGAALLLGLALVWEPGLVAPLADLLRQGALPEALVRCVGFVLLGACGIYVVGAFMGFKERRLGRWTLRYPRPAVVLQQMVAGPMEIVGAAAIIYFALPTEGNPGYLTVLGGFLISFCVGLLAQVPGGMGVMEAVFLALMPALPASEVIAALLVWRIFYLLVPLALSGPIILGFERLRWSQGSRS